MQESSSGWPQFSLQQLMALLASSVRGLQGGALPRGVLPLMLPPLPKASVADRSAHATAELILIRASNLVDGFRNSTSGAAEAAARLGVVDALLPLLAPGGSWVIQGRCCGLLTLLIRQELRTHVRRRRLHQRFRGYEWAISVSLEAEAKAVHLESGIPGQGLGPGATQ